MQLEQTFLANVSLESLTHRERPHGRHDENSVTNGRTELVRRNSHEWSGGAGFGVKLPEKTVATLVEKWKQRMA